MQFILITEFVFSCVTCQLTGKPKKPIHPLGNKVSPARDLKNASSPPVPWPGMAAEGPWVPPPKSFTWTQVTANGTAQMGLSDTSHCQTHKYTPENSVMVPPPSFRCGLAHPTAQPLQRTIPTLWLFPMDLWCLLAVCAPVQWVIAGENLPNCTVYSWLEGTCYWWHNTL